MNKEKEMYTAFEKRVKMWWDNKNETERITQVGDVGFKLGVINLNTLESNKNWDELNHHQKLKITFIYIQTEYSFKF